MKGVKRLIILGVALMMWIFAGGIAHATSCSDTIIIFATIDPIIRFEIWEDTVDLGTHAAGENAYGSVTMSCGTNCNRLWGLAVEATPLATRDGYRIPTPNFRYSTFSTGDAEDGKGTYFSPIPFYSRQAAYWPTSSELSDTYVKVNMGFHVDVPYNAPTGTYISTVTLTMTVW